MNGSSAVQNPPPGRADVRPYATIPSVSNAATLRDVYLPIRRELDQVRSQVEGLWADCIRLLNGSSLQYHMQPGKMLRPALCLLGAGALDANPLDDFVPLATALEVLHIAALAHDDVVDGANLRRGQVSLNAAWDDRVAVIGGDYLVARALAGMGAYRCAGLMGAAIDSIREMTEAELAIIGRKGERFERKDCLAVAEKKTGSLFAVAAAAAAWVSNKDLVEPLSAYGRAFGIAFQVIDDVLDLVQSEDALGKPTCSDLAEGKTTLPILFLRQRLDRQDAKRLRQMEGALIPKADRRWVADIAERSGARKDAEAVAREYGQKACAALDALPAGTCREALGQLTEVTVARGF